MGLNRVVSPGRQPVGARSMLLQRSRWLVSGMIGLGALSITDVFDSRAATAADPPPVLQGPIGDGALMPDYPRDDDAIPPKPTAGPPHEASQGGAAASGRIRAPKAPPQPIVERPFGDRPEPNAQ